MLDNTTFDFLFKRMDGLPALHKGLDVFSTRQKIISSNIANAETPGYRAQRVTFEDQLQKVLRINDTGLSQTSHSHMPHQRAMREMERVHPQIEKDSVEPFFNGVNNVDIEKEMTAMASNGIHFEATAKVLNIRYKMLQGAIKGRVI